VNFGRDGTTDGKISPLETVTLEEKIDGGPIQPNLAAPTRRGNHHVRVGNSHKSLSKRVEISVIWASVRGATRFRVTRRTHNQQGRNASSSAVPATRNRA
jgi:hypothetical protein